MAPIKKESTFWWQALFHVISIWHAHTQERCHATQLSEGKKTTHYPYFLKHMPANYMNAEVGLFKGETAGWGKVNQKSSIARTTRSTHPLNL